MQIYAEPTPLQAPRRSPLRQDAGPSLTRAEIAELAARFIDAANQVERDHVLAAAMTHAAHRAGGPLPTPTGRRLGAMLRPLGPSLEPAAKAGMELERLDADDRAFMDAQRFIQLAATAAAHAQSGSPGSARAAFVAVTGVQPPRIPAPFDYDPEMEYFLGGLVRSAGRVVRNVSRAVDKAASAVGKIPILGDVARAGLGAARLGLGPTAIAFDVGSRVARGQKLGTALKGAVGGQLDAVRSQLKLAEMVAPFVPGIGQGVAAALGAANALAAGRPITEALLASARAALPGGAIAQAAFDTAINLAKGKSIGEAALAAARERLPGGAAAKAAFDGAVALGQGKKLQDAAFAAAGRVLPASPYAADALDFVKRVGRGQNLQHAALSIVGKRALGQAMVQARRPAQRELEYEFAWTPPPAELAGRRTATSRNLGSEDETQHMVPEPRRRTKIIHTAGESKKTVSVDNARQRASALSQRRRVVLAFIPTIRLVMEPSLGRVNVPMKVIESIVWNLANEVAGAIMADPTISIQNLIGQTVISRVLNRINDSSHFLEESMIPVIAAASSSILMHDLPPVIKAGAVTAIIFGARKRDRLKMGSTH
jgi:hypothetical protein